MPELTDKSRANLAAGYVSGAGTDVCRECRGTKEPTRLNSYSCRTCAAIRAGLQVPVEPGVSGVPVPDDAAARLDRQALAIKQLRADRDRLMQRLLHLELDHASRHLCMECHRTTQPHRLTADSTDPC